MPSSTPPTSPPPGPWSEAGSTARSRCWAKATELGPARPHLSQAESWTSRLSRRGDNLVGPVDLNQEATMRSVGLWQACLVAAGVLSAFAGGHAFAQNPPSI